MILQVFGLYKGVTPPLVGQLIINAAIFGVHGNTLRRLPDQGTKGQFIAGGLAGAVQSIFCSPIELVKTRMQLQDQGIQLADISKSITDHHRYKDSFDCFEKILRYEGIKGCMRGFNCTLIREVPSLAVYFASYHSLCQYFRTDAGSISIPSLFLSGGISGILAWFVSYPADVIKTRLQADGLGSNKYNGIIDCCSKSYKREGWRVFFTGLNVTLLRAFPTNAATLATVTLFLDSFDSEVSDE